METGGSSKAKGVPACCWLGLCWSIDSRCQRRYLARPESTRCTMSWQAYVDNQICSQVQCRVAVIAGLNDGAVWAKFEKEPSVSVTQQELKALADGMRSNPGAFTENGIYLGGEKYYCLYAENSLLRGRKGSSALIVVATNTCLLAAATIDGFPPGQLNTVVEKLGDYLRASNY